MSGLIKTKASNDSLSLRKLAHGVGINDANYAIYPVVNGKQVMCPYFLAWNNMLNRCYQPKYHKKQPTYIGCSVTKEWLTFSNFKAWMEKQSWKGKCLDKDILVQNNKVYGPETCLFVTSSINNLLIDCGSNRGEWPIGVHFYKSSGRFRSQCAVGSKKKHLGMYSTPGEAHEAYKKFKYAHIANIANQQSEPLRSALINYVIE
jgi:hypothetical protein